MYTTNTFLRCLSANKISLSKRTPVHSIRAISKFLFPYPRHQPEAPRHDEQFAPTFYLGIYKRWLIPPRSKMIVYRTVEPSSERAPANSKVIRQFSWDYVVLGPNFIILINMFLIKTLISSNNVYNVLAKVVLKHS